MEENARVTRPKRGREVLKFALRAQGGKPHVREPTFTRVGEDKVIGSWQWLASDGERHQRFQVLTFREEKIIDMQDCSSHRQANRFAHTR